MAVDWGYYDNPKFETLNKKYLPNRGEGETKATQVITCVNKLVYRWYNDGDVYDNTYLLGGWGNDLSSYANWLYANTTTKVKIILNGIEECIDDDDYEDLLQDLADKLFNEEYLTEQDKLEKVDSIYTCSGKFKFEEIENEDDYYDDDEEEYYY